MSPGLRRLIAVGGIALALALASLAGRWWVGESWDTVITMCVLEVLILLALIGTRRARRKR